MHVGFSLGTDENWFEAVKNVIISKTKKIGAK